MESNGSNSLPVSVIIPAYNASETIAETLNSLRGQVYEEWEAIIVDDGSTDSTKEIAEHYVHQDSRFRLIQRNQGGESAARNTGLENARTEWLLFLDADDWISPSHLQKMTHILKRDPQLDGVHCKWARVALDGTIIEEKYQASEGDLFPVLARRPAFPVHACVIRRSKVEEVGKFDTTLIKSPDWDLWQRIARTGAKFGAISEILAFYRMRSNAASMDAHQLLVDDLRILKQGHSRDPRVLNPHPDHIEGMPEDQISTQIFYLLSWCAGVLLGSGKDPRPLFDVVKDYQFPELYPEAVAQCLFDSVPLPVCQSPEQWENLALSTLVEADEFLKILEDRAKAEGLAHAAGIALRKMILNSSDKWRPVIDAYESTIRKEKEEYSRSLDQKNTHLQELDSEIQQRDARIQELDSRIQTSESQMQELNVQIQEKNQKLRDQEQNVLMLQREKDTIITERNEWQTYGQERQATLSELSSSMWIRFGLKLGFLNDPLKIPWDRTKNERLVKRSLRYIATSCAVIFLSAIQCAYFLFDRPSIIQFVMAIFLAIITAIMALVNIFQRDSSILRWIFVLYVAQLSLFVYRLMNLGPSPEHRLMFIILLAVHVAISIGFLLRVFQSISKRKTVLMWIPLIVALPLYEFVLNLQQ